MNSGSQHDMKNTVLILDDVESVANLLHKVAARENLEVIKAYSNAQAIQALEDADRRARLRVAFLDLMVGTESGLTVYRRLRELEPTLPVVLMSGYVFNVVIPPLLAKDRHTVFMLKPFELSMARELMKDPLGHGGNLLQRPLDSAFT
jgi:DNA-binding NtrC family response regulator